MVRVGFDPRSFSPWDGRSPVSHPTCDVPFPPRRPGEYRKGMIPARPLYQGVRGSVWDPETSRERVGDWGGPETVWALFRMSSASSRTAPSPTPPPKARLFLIARAPPRGSVLLLFACRQTRVRLCVAERRTTRPNGEWGYSTRRHILGPERPEAVSPGRGVVLTDLQSSSDCQ
jgi:hypothetical protein